MCRSARAEEPIWGEDEGFSDHDYYNSIPGKEPPIGGVVDSRLRGSAALLGHIHSQPQSYTPAQVTVCPESHLRGRVALPDGLKRASHQLLARLDA